MNATGLLKRMLVGGAIIAATASPAFSQAKTNAAAESVTAQAQSSAPVKASIEALISSEEGMSYSRAHVWYELPGHVQGYTFIELYDKGKGYLGKTSLSKSVGKTFSIQGQVLQCSEYFTSAGIGVGAKIPTPKGMSAAAAFYPAYFGKDGLVKDKMIAKYSVGAKLAHGISIGSFGEVNVAAKGGPKWSYGEAYFTKSFWKHYEAGLSVGLRNKGGVVPRPEYRTTIQYKF